MSSKTVSIRFLPLECWMRKRTDRIRNLLFLLRRCDLAEATILGHDATTKFTIVRAHKFSVYFKYDEFTLFMTKSFTTDLQRNGRSLAVSAVGISAALQAGRWGRHSSRWRPPTRCCTARGVFT
jgi:hypothetical protein